MSSTKPKKSHKHKDKSKHKEKHSSGQPSSIQTPHGKNEGSNTELAYQPPPGAILANHLNDAGDFDWDAIRDNDEGLELWIVRVPNGVRISFYIVLL